MTIVSPVQRQIVFYLVPDFTLLAFSSAIEALRLANSVLGVEAYTWRVTSAVEGKVRASCGVSVEVDNAIAMERQHLNSWQRPSMVVVCAGKNVAEHSDRAASAWLRECRNRGVALAALCSGAHVLATAGLLDDKECAIHWEHMPGFVERFVDASVTAGIYHVDSNIYTCAGGAATFDMMLHIIERDYDARVVSGICELALVDRVREPGDRQRLPFSRRVSVQDPKVVALVAKMEQNLTEPLETDDLTAIVGLSRRQIERLFRSELGCSPARYYLKLRLERAHLLLVQTTIPVIEIAIACGFASGSHFSKCYRETYGCTPLETRGQLTNRERSRSVSARTLDPGRDAQLDSFAHRLSA
ncbi:GlxA family transcriptional regulator [Sinorhizobium sp. BG8]|uniref:GlxA family transcriptional regulator n=1 Tax=Sinorhizobium sp. BG8 TaxID=2613773 RepID=UPI00193E9A2F|nr:GlxA family transcriptional regulator [Sinorhizobium sp. BG8]QRM54354.1 GlxA family transcriptional regulator [Sinorhizobium sp. BG8]